MASGAIFKIITRLDLDPLKGRNTGQGRIKGNSTPFSSTGNIPKGLKGERGADEMPTARHSWLLRSWDRAPALIIIVSSAMIRHLLSLSVHGLHIWKPECLGGREQRGEEGAEGEQGAAATRVQGDCGIAALTPASPNPCTSQVQGCHSARIPVLCARRAYPCEQQTTTRPCHRGPRGLLFPSPACSPPGGTPTRQAAAAPAK